MRRILNVLIPLLFSRFQEACHEIELSLLAQCYAKTKQHEYISARSNAELFPAAPLGYEDKAREGNCFVLLMNDDEYTQVHKRACMWVRVECLKLVAATNECLCDSHSAGGPEALRSSQTEISLVQQLEFLLRVTACS